MNTCLDYTDFPHVLLLAPDLLPDLVLTVDFGGLAAFDQSPGIDGTMQRKLLKVYSALTNITEDVLATTRPTLLSPGMNLRGVVNPVIRKRFRAPELSAFGLFDVSPLKDDHYGYTSHHEYLDRNSEL
jgi:hypothetical protein